MCSYTIAHCATGISGTPEWILHLRTWVHPGWLEDLRSTVVATFDGTVKRRGALVHAKNCLWSQKVIRSMINGSVPFWIYWGDTNALNRVSESLTAYRPDHSLVIQKIKELDNAMNIPTPYPDTDDIGPFHADPDTNDNTHSFHADPVPDQDVTASSVDGMHSLDSATDFPTETDLTSVAPLEVDTEIPIPEKGSRQLLGETWQAFFERHEQIYSTWTQNATPEELRVWDDRRRTNGSSLLPGRRGAVVWEWQKINGYDIRMKVSRGEVESVFLDYAPSHRRYNPFAKEWDLNYEFDSDTPAPVDYDNEDEIEDYFNPTKCSLPIGQVPIESLIDNSQRDVIAETFRIDMNYAYGGIDRPLEIVPVSLPSILDILRNRYGLLLNGSSPPPPSQIPPHKLENILGAPVPSGAAISHISFFVSVISLGKYDAIPKAAWDLSPSSTNFLQAITPSPCMVSLVGSESVIQFVMRPRVDPEGPKWYLMVKDAVTVLECQRRFHNKPLEYIVLHLVRYGLPFTRVVTSSLDSTTPVRHQPPQFTFFRRVQPFVANDESNSLGLRWPDYMPDHADYVAYWQKLISFLEGPRGHFAVTMGGIVWRLAIHALGFQKASDIVLSSQVQQNPNRRYASSHRSFDEPDGLSNPELEFISGTYHVYTAKGEQVAKKSWWPSHHVWTGSGRDTGYWSESAEKWFCLRLGEITNNPGTALKRGREWSNSLRFDGKDTRAFREKSNTAATMFLSSRDSFA
jgi:hypothetical protein